MVRSKLGLTVVVIVGTLMLIGIDVLIAHQNWWFLFGIEVVAIVLYAVSSLKRRR